MASQANTSSKAHLESSITHSHSRQPSSQSYLSNARLGTSTSNPRIPSSSVQPRYPSPIQTLPTDEQPHVRVTTPSRWSLRNAFIGGGNPDFTSNSPFRSRSGTGGSSTHSSRARPRTRRPSSSRLWNPTNSTPRVPTRKRNRRSQGEDAGILPVAIPLSHPDIGAPREGAAAGGSYPLLTLPEKRQSLHLGSARASLQIERTGSSNGSNRVSLPRTVSIDIQRRKSGESPTTPPKILDKGKGRAIESEEHERPVTGYRQRGRSVSKTTSGLSFDKSKATMSTDLERGPNPQYHPEGTSHLPHNASNTSLHTGIGPAMSSSNSSIIGSDGPGNAAEEWGPQHPCYPHMNSHVPLSSPLYQTTRIIRIKRDWMIAGDLAPTFSNLYPEILDPAGVSEQEFRTIIDKVNKELEPAFNPWASRNLFDSTMGLLTGWIWDDLGFTAVKSRLTNVERYLEEWNKKMEGKGKEGPHSAPRIFPLRRTGYMNVSCIFRL